MKASEVYFAEDLPGEQALRELRMNLLEQYGPYEVWFYLDRLIEMYQFNLARQNIDKMFKEIGSRH